MKSIVFAFFFLCMALAAQAQSYPERHSILINDLGGLLSPTERVVLATYLVDARIDADADMTLLTLRSVAEYSSQPIAEFAGGVHADWGLGGTGILVLVVGDAREIWIALGPAYPDRARERAALESGSVDRDIQRNDLAGGIMARLDQVMAPVSASDLAAREPQPEPSQTLPFEPVEGVSPEPPAIEPAYPERDARLVNDLAELLTGGARRQLAQDMAQVRVGTGVGLVLATVGSVAEYSSPAVEAFAAGLHADWGLDPGDILILVAAEEQALWIELGPDYPAGLRALAAVESGRVELPVQSRALMAEIYAQIDFIEDQIVQRHLRGEAWGQGDQATTASGSAPEPDQTTPEPPATDVSPEAVLLWVAGGLGVLVGGGVWASRPKPTLRGLLAGFERGLSKLELTDAALDVLRNRPRAIAMPAPVPRSTRPTSIPATRRSPDPARSPASEPAPRSKAEPSSRPSPEPVQSPPPRPTSGPASSPAPIPAPSPEPGPAPTPPTRAPRLPSLFARKEICPACQNRSLVEIGRAPTAGAHGAQERHMRCSQCSYEVVRAVLPS